MTFIPQIGVGCDKTFFFPCNNKIKWPKMTKNEKWIRFLFQKQNCSFSCNAPLRWLKKNFGVKKHFFWQNRFYFFSVSGPYYTKKKQQKKKRKTKLFFFFDHKSQVFAYYTGKKCKNVFFFGKKHRFFFIKKRFHVILPKTQNDFVAVLLSHITRKKLILSHMTLTPML